MKTKNYFKSIYKRYKSVTIKTEIMNEDFLELDDATGVEFSYEWQDYEPDNNVSEGWIISIRSVILRTHLIADIDLLDKLDSQDISNIEQVIENYLNNK